LHIFYFASFEKLIIEECWKTQINRETLETQNYFTRQFIVFVSYILLVLYISQGHFEYFVASISVVKWEFISEDKVNSTIWQCEFVHIGIRKAEHINNFDTKKIWHFFGYNRKLMLLKQCTQHQIKKKYCDRKILS